jgi:Uma2 family endonuclease
VYEVDQEVDDYLAAGVRLVWMVNPERRTVWVYRVDGPVRFLREPDELSGEDVLPGFRCLVSELFPPMPAAAQPAPVSPSSG